MNDRFTEAEQLRKEIAEKEARLKEIEKNTFNPYGTWKVTTEGDEEGRTTKRLGSFEGSIFDIAKSLHNQVNRSLNFIRVGYLNIEQIKKPKVKSVNVTIEDDRTTVLDIAKVMEFAPEDVDVSDGNYYNSLKFTFK